MMKTLEGQNALVTGGSRGIGRTIAMALAQAGARVTLTYHTNEDLAQEVVEQIERDGGHAWCCALDVTDRQSVRALARMQLRDGPISILINNAGINQPADFDQITDCAWDAVLGTNLKGPFIVTQEFFAQLKDAAPASVINIGSVSGQYGGPRTAHYAASKAGLISLGQVIARFGAPHKIRCNTIAAGLIASDMAEGALSAPAVSQAAKSILLGRLGTTEDVARACVFLAGPDAQYITAQTLNVNGGLYF